MVANTLGSGAGVVDTGGGRDFLDADNELTAFGATTYTSDADGHRLTSTTSGVTTSYYTWDARGRLQSIVSVGTAWFHLSSTIRATR